MSDEIEKLRAAIQSAIDELEEHLGDGCAGPNGTGRRGACSECRIAAHLRQALEATDE